MAQGASCTLVGTNAFGNDERVRYETKGNCDDAADVDVWSNEER